MVRWLLAPLFLTSVALADADKATLDKITKGLKSNKLEPMLSAIDQARSLGEDAKPIAAEIARQIINPNKKISTAALEAYEKIEPEVHPLLVTAVVEKNNSKRLGAIRKLEAMGEQARTALPVLSHLFTQETKDLDGDWGPLLDALVKIDGGDNFVVSQVLGFAHQETPKGSNSKEREYRERARGHAIRAMGHIAVPSEKKVKALLAALGNSTTEFHRVKAIQELEKMGTAAQSALPQLRALKTDGAARVRDAATSAIAAIEKK